METSAPGWHGFNQSCNLLLEKLLYMKQSGCDTSLMTRFMFENRRKGNYSFLGRTLASNIIGISRSVFHSSLEMTYLDVEPFLCLSLRGARQGDVAISAQEWRRLLRLARNDIKEVGLRRF